MWKKRMLSVLLVCVLCVAIIVPASANNDISCESINDVAVKVFEVDSEEEIDQLFAEQQEIEPRTAFVGCYLVRNGTTKDCEVFLKWSGDARYNGWRFKKLTITNFSVTNKVTYGTISAPAGKTYRTYTVPSSDSSNVELGSIKVPTDIEEVKCKFDSLQGSTSASTDWLSVGWFTEKAGIN